MTTRPSGSRQETDGLTESRSLLDQRRSTGAIDLPEEARMASMKPAELRSLLEHEALVPQAIIGQSIGTLAEDLGVALQTGHDDLDEYAGAAFELDGLPFALMRYEGHPSNESTIYLPRRLQDVEEITAVVHQITAVLEIPDDAIVWERRDNPDL